MKSLCSVVRVIGGEGTGGEVEACSIFTAASWSFVRDRS